ncbi:Sec-independent protein translocase subunit TatA/TatB [Pontibacter ruber]|uniref:Sec-independent protein translocase protein TatA n=1 Tax=Pontibacter ruber TaxID=1343895 RepID=A0ABW5D3M7_9BACT|nr:twin-arginine translocase TatA/TatE family subunit [Pontibacter ruber]
MLLETVLLFLGDLGGGELLVIFTAVLLLFGADKIPGIARSFGRGIREFKDATNEIKSEIERSIEDGNKPK